jgi:hypothetical protein
MLKDLGRMFRKSLEAFRAEVGTREPEDQVAELLTAMRRELTRAKADIPLHEEELIQSRALLANERTALAQCERRLAMARNIGDEETSRVAGEFAERHRQKIGVLEAKAAAAEAELELKRKEADEMRLRYLEADANRFVLSARLRQSGRSVLDESAVKDDQAFHDFGRMEEKVVSNSMYIDALKELDDSPPPPRGPTPPSVEDQLAELKKKMGK